MDPVDPALLGRNLAEETRPRGGGSGAIVPRREAASASETAPPSVAYARPDRRGAFIVPLIGVEASMVPAWPARAELGQSWFLDPSPNAEIRDLTPRRSRGSRHRVTSPRGSPWTRATTRTRLPVALALVLVAAAAAAAGPAAARGAQCRRRSRVRLRPARRPSQMGCVPGDDCGAETTGKDEQPAPPGEARPRAVWLGRDRGHGRGVHALRRRRRGGARRRRWTAGASSSTGRGPCAAEGMSWRSPGFEQGPDASGRRRELVRRGGLLRVVRRPAADRGGVGASGARRRRRPDLPWGDDPVPLVGRRARRPTSRTSRRSASSRRGRTVRGLRRRPRAHGAGRELRGERATASSTWRATSPSGAPTGTTTGYYASRGAGRRSRAARRAASSGSCAAARGSTTRRSCRVSRRYFDKPATHKVFIGFRCARDALAGPRDARARGCRGKGTVSEEGRLRARAAGAVRDGLRRGRPRLPGRREAAAPRRAHEGRLARRGPR